MDLSTKPISDSSEIQAFILFCLMATPSYEGHFVVRASPAPCNLNNYTMDYKTRLFHLKLLPLMYVLELHDVLFLIKSLNSPTSSFNISDHVCFNNSHTRSSSSKLCHRNSDNVITANSYFYRIPRLWNALPIIDLSHSLPTIKHKLFFYGH